MKIEQIQKDLDEGVIISRDTLCKLVQAAKIMGDALHEIADETGDSYAHNASLVAIIKVETL